MKAAFIVFDGMTALDFFGFYDPLTRLKSMAIDPAFEWRLCARSPQVADDRGARILADAVGEDLGGFDLVFVPGGFGTRALQRERAFVEWIATAAPARLKVSVCTGALLLGAAGFLRGRRATTHPNAYGELAPYCAKVLDERVVDEGDVITARGVASSIDLGLHVVERMAGAEARTRVAKQMDYPYRWEAGAGSPSMGG
jgi:transcriptional regulator GlxA family with amidase domain